LILVEVKMEMCNNKNKIENLTVRLTE